jgi:hypothetical protein
METIKVCRWQPISPITTTYKEPEYIITNDEINEISDGRSLVTKPSIHVKYTPSPPVIICIPASTIQSEYLS